MNNTIEEIRKQQTLQLPSEEAHIPMSPGGRGRSSEAIKHAKNYRESAVALVIYEKHKELKGVLTERSPYRGLHSGEVCLPGGKMEDFDQSRSEEHTSELQSRPHLVCRLLLEKKNDDSLT